MSSILNGIGGGLSQFIQKLTSHKSSVQTAAGSAGASLGQILTGTHQGHHGGNRQLFQKIQQAVTTALQQNQATGASNAAGASDPNQAIESAIVKVLQANSASGSSATDADAITNPASDQAANQSFMQMLKANGVTPEQFRNDWLAAVQQTGGQSGLAQMAGQFPPGLLVNTLG